MLYCEYMDKVKEIALWESTDTGKTYIVPDYEYNLAHQEFSLADVTDFPGADMNTVRRQLELERDMRNAQKDYTMEVMKWLHQFIDGAVQPTMTDAENKIMEMLMNYQKDQQKKDNHNVSEKTKMVFDNGFVLHKKEIK